MDRGTGILTHAYGTGRIFEVNLLYPIPRAAVLYPRNQETISSFPKDVND